MGIVGDTTPVSVVLTGIGVLAVATTNALAGTNSKRHT